MVANQQDGEEIIVDARLANPKGASQTGILLFLLAGAGIAGATLYVLYSKKIIPGVSADGKPPRIEPPSFSNNRWPDLPDNTNQTWPFVSDRATGRVYRNLRDNTVAEYVSNPDVIRGRPIYSQPVGSAWWIALRGQLGLPTSSQEVPSVVVQPPIVVAQPPATNRCPDLPGDTNRDWPFVSDQATGKVYRNRSDNSIAEYISNPDIICGRPIYSQPVGSAWWIALRGQLGLPT